MANNSRRASWIGAAVLALASSWARAARAEDQTIGASAGAVAAPPVQPTSASELPPPEPPRPVRERKAEAESYALPLGIAYLLTPGIALAAGMGLSELEAHDGVVVLGAGAMFAIPAGVHLYNERPARAGVSLAMTVGFTMGGVFAGGLAGYAVGSFGCDGDDCFKALDYMPVGAFIGGALGYVSHAIWDVAAHSDALKDPEAITQGAPVLWFSPTVSRREHDGQREAQLDGFQMGLTLRM